MSIAHELSSDVAAAVLAADKKESPRDTSTRAEIVKEIHSTLRRINAENSRKLRDGEGDAPLYKEGVASGRR